MWEVSQTSDDAIFSIAYVAIHVAIAYNIDDHHGHLYI